MATEDVAAAPDQAAAELYARQVIQDAYSVVEGRRHTDTVAAKTIGDLAQEQIDHISKDTSPIRPSQLSEVDRIEMEITKVVAYVKKQHPDKFKPKLRSAEEGVNTPKKV